MISKRTRLSIIYITVYATILGGLMTFSPEKAPMVSYIGLILSAFVNPVLLVCSYICIRMFDIVHTSFQVLSMEAIIMIYCLLNIYKYNKQLSKYISATLIFGFFAVLSAILGFDTSIKDVIPFVFLFLIFLSIPTILMSSQEDLIISTLFVTGIVIAFFAYYHFGSVGFFSETGKLSMGGNIRRVSNAAAFPLFFSIYKLFSKPKNFILIALWSFLILFLGTILILTYSRGVIGASLVTAIYLLLFNSERIGFTKIFVSLLAVGLVYSIINYINIDTELMFHDLDTASGRTDIWEYYNTQLVQGGGFRIFFGFGPGDTLRVVQSSSYADQYAHSLFLDFFYCFGIAGALYLLFVLINIAWSLFKGKNKFYIGLFILSIAMYLTHGTAAQIHFYIMMGICLGGAVSKVFINRVPSSENNK